MAAASGHWFLNGIDTYDAYGLLVMEGNGQFLLFPERKESLSYEWAEVNGRDIDLSTPRFKVKEVKLRCAFVADTEAEYWANRNAFFTALAVTPGWQIWRINDHSRDYSVYYKDMSEPKLLTRRLKNIDKIVYAFSLELVVNEEIITNPVISTESVYIRDQDGNMIATLPPGSTYTLTAHTVSYNGVYQLTLLPGQNLNVVSPYSMKFIVTL